MKRRQAGNVIDVEAVNANEDDRLAALHEYCLLDEPADEELNAVIRVATMVADVPTAALNLIDENRQCQLSAVGFVGCDTDRKDSMCAVQFRTGRLVHVPDARQHPLYRDNPWVTGRLGEVRFYGSAPLITPEGYVLGTLCVFDDKVKELTPEQVNRIRDLADVLVALFERRRQTRITKELAAETERSKQFTDTVLETIDVGIAVADSAGSLTMLNRAAREWHSFSLPDSTTELFDLVDANGPIEQERLPLIRTLHGDDVNGTELVIRKRETAEEIALSINGRRLVAHDGTLLGAVLAMNNVTSDRTYRRELERAHAELASRGEQLTAAVIELERSNEELEHFAGAVSHDLVRPMAAAHGYLELLTDTYAPEMDERARAWLLSATRAVERMQALVEALLRYARAGHAPYEPQPVNLSEVFGDVLADLQPALRAANASVTAAGKLPVITGDPTLLRQLLQNLIDNAVKYRAEDRVCRIKVAAHRHDQTWELSVADNGVGIPEDQRDRVFEMFAQINPEARKGHGIGLSTCQRIVERHNGAISITETPGGGTTIVLHLPA